MNNNRRVLATVLAAALVISPWIAKGQELPDLFGGKFLPMNFSLNQHKVPDWFQDAKLGIFIHWGIYSVPAWAQPSRPDFEKKGPQFAENPYAEWYLNTMKIKGSPTANHHRETYGENFDYYDFIPVFNREVQKWNPEDWAKLFKEVGAQYVVLTTKHHDGFTLWPSKVPNPHLPADRQHASRDLVGELTQSVRAHGLKMGLYYSGGLDWSFVKTPIQTIQDLFMNAPQSQEYADYADAHWRELIKDYQPSVLWNDISYPQKGKALSIIADYYNAGRDGIVNNRWDSPAGSIHHDFTTPEYSSYKKIVSEKWESCRGLGFSFGYNQAEGPEQVLPADQLVDLLVDIVSKNGNLLLNVGPKADGTISEIQMDRLRELGRWLKVNGEAIYATRPWVTAEGATRDKVRVRFTQKADSVYAILLDKPKASHFILERLTPASDNTTIEMLGGGGKLSWKKVGTDLQVALPQTLSDSHAYTLKITPKPYKLMRE